MKIDILDRFFSAGVDLLARQAEVVLWDDPRVGEWREDADALVVRLSRLTADDFARARKLKVVSKQGAGLDVFETEPPTVANPLIGLPNVVATPHAAGGTRENQERSSRLVAQQLLDVLEGREPFHRLV
jgi:D-3-phosphoglycerate dehydrogenase